VPMLYVVNTKIPQQPSGERTYTLPVWSYLPCVLESLLNSEIPGHFTVRITRPVMDATGAVVLIPQGQRVGAKATSGELLLGNERIPTFALSLQQADGTPLELGDAPIMDAAGTNGLTGEVDNHVWRLVWTSIFLGGLQAGQQMLQTGLGAEHGGAVAAGIAQQGNQAARMRLGRAQDTRPTIRVFAGEGCQILTPKAWSLPAAS
jgi:type IV secretory pathway VirB10-like protein